MAKFRIGNCLRVRQKQKDIQVWKSIEHGSADYKGLQTCGSVWVCPVCAAKIAARRRVEIQSAMALHSAAGGGVFLLTTTTPHQRTDKLSDLLAKQAKALKSFHSDRTVRDVFKKMGVIGQIRALEVTHGRLSESNNGWHPHYHFLLFGASGLDLTQFFDDLYIRWHACCVRAGLGAPSIAHGLKLDDGSKASAYVSKWGLEDEMTKGHTKKALHGETPFDFLRAYLDDPTDNQARILFQEFGETFKGKRQLHWSTGLKEHFKIGDFSDEELSVQIDDHSVLLGTLTVEQWRDVLRAEGRGLLLVYAEAQGWEGVQQYLNSISTKGENVQTRS